MPPRVRNQGCTKRPPSAVPALLLYCPAGYDTVSVHLLRGYSCSLWSLSWQGDISGRSCQGTEMISPTTTIVGEVPVPGQLHPARRCLSSSSTLSSAQSHGIRPLKKSPCVPSPRLQQHNRGLSADRFAASCRIIIVSAWVGLLEPAKEGW